MFPPLQENRVTDQPKNPQYRTSSFQESIALVPDSKDSQIGQNSPVAHLLVHVLCRLPELPTNLFFLAESSASCNFLGDASSSGLP